MSSTPKRPIVLRFVFGKGLVKRRQESANTARAVVEQATIAWTEGSWEQRKKELASKVAEDVRAELVHLAGLFRRNVVGAPGSQRGLVGRLDTLVGGPSETLGSLPRWAPRGAKYLRRKQDFAGNTNWFDNSDWTGGTPPPMAGHLRRVFASQSKSTPGGAMVHIGSGGIFETMFGLISVDIVRNNLGATGANTVRLDRKGDHMQVQLGTIRVRALGRVTERMLTISDRPNTALLDVVAETDPTAALHLRGGRGRYRPALEPYLRFFLRRAIPAAVEARLKKGSAQGYAR